ncbi:MAG: S8 family serine peptidase, partial [Planctomycetes bacterium]|nr:S8 family serine peptidase [Planctomycetota bacterium]
MAICDRLVRPKGPSVALAGPAAAMALEALEPRVMLSSAPAGGISSVWAAPIMPAWFHVLDSGVSQSQAHENEWIVQFTSDALRHVDSVADTIDLFASSPINFDILKGLGQAGQVLVKANDANTAYVEQWLSGNPGIAYYQPNYVMQLWALPDDPSFDELWGLNNTGQDGGTADADIDAPEAWDYTIGSADIIVGVTDTGVDYTHPDLADNMWINPGETADNGIDDDGNGFIDDIYGWDFGDDDSDPMDDSSIAGHGTHVAGTIGAVGDNGVGVAGVNWDVSIMALKIADQMGFQWNSSIIAANNYAAMMRTSFGVNICVTNNSYGGYGSDQGIYDSIKRLQSAGILFVAAAGNDDINNDTIPAYPASYDLDNIISVAATDRNDELASFSNYGKTSVDLSAPGVEILSTVPNGQYDGTYSGTSMACPHVVGVAALAWSFAPNATYQEIRDAILHGVDLLPDLRGKVATDGRLNAYNTLLQLSIATIQGSLFHDLNADGQRDPDPQVEPGLAGWTIYADENANRRYDVGEATGVTDADGNYEITGLQPGSYELAAIRSDGWVSTRPQSGFIAVQLRLPDEPGDYVVLADDLGVTNLGPTAIEQAVALDEDASLAITLAGTDVHEFEGVPLFEGIHDTPADELIFALTSQPAHGTLNVSRLAEGIIVYTPQANYNGDDEFYFTVTDTGNPADGSEGNAGTSDPVAVSITVTPVNDQPTAYGQWTLTNQDATGNITITLIGADLETEAGDLLFNAGDPAHGTLTALAGPNGPSWGYQPDVGYFGVDKFTFTVTDDGDPAGSGANPGNLDSEPVTVYVGVAQKVSIDSGEQYAFEVAAGVVGTVRLSGPGLATLYDASALVDADTGQAHPDPRHITEILIEGADDSTSLTFRMPRGARACLGGITVEGGSFG